MKNNRKFVKLANRWWPVMHRRFEEMCVLAVTGQLGGPEMYELNGHIAACDSCRKYLESIAQVSLEAMPVLAEKHEPAGNVVPPEGMRDRFLSRLAAKGPDSKTHGHEYPSPVVVRQLISLPLDRWTKNNGPGEKTTTAVRGSFPMVWRSVAALAACAAIGAAGYSVGQRKHAEAPAVATQSVNSAVPEQKSTGAVELDRVGELQRQKSQLAGEVAEMKDKFAKATAEDESLRDQLSAAKLRLATLTAQTQSAFESSAALPGSRDQIPALEAQVGNVSQRLAESEVKLDVEKQANKELTANLESTTAELRRERDIQSATNEMGDLVAARNLHIVDVYDADSSGKRQRSFGRVFYVEGKSLVFYAYDLDDPGQHRANVVFHVWGGNAGVKEVTRSLGILNKDAAGDSRWAMTFDDPGVLSQINSVFVTAEPANKHSDEPRGKKILYAYFGSAPNHP
jgi:TolA-binding protein